MGALGVQRGTHTPSLCSLFQNFIKAKQYPPNTQVEVQNDGAESAVFQQLFQKWTLPNQTSGLGKIHNLGAVGECWPEAGWGWELEWGWESIRACLLSFSDAPLPCALLPWLWAPE